MKILNSLVDDRGKVNQEAEKLTEAAEKSDFKSNNPGKLGRFGKVPAI